jgi:hypothetical protein
MSKPIKDIQLYNDLCAVEDVLRRDGWCQHMLEDPSGRHCLMGAVTEVTPEYDRWFAMQDAVKSVVPWRNVSGFNDHPTTTFDKVLAKLKEARDRLVG